MPETTQPKLITLDGRGKLVSNVGSHGNVIDEAYFKAQYSPMGFASMVDCITDVAGRLRKRPGTFAIGAAAGSPMSAIHEYTRIDPATGDLLRWIFRASGSIFQYWTGTTWTTMAIPITVSANQRGWIFCNFNNRVFAVNGADAMIVFDGTKWRLAGALDPLVAPTYSLAGVYSLGTVSCTNGQQLILGIGTSWASLAATAKWIDINGFRYQILSVNSNTSITLNTTFGQATATLGYLLYFGLMSWVNPPVYAYAYYNPETGHISNRSPLLQITEQNETLTTPTITIIGSAENTAAYNNGYTQIKLFRSAAEGITLVEIDIAIPNVNTGANITFVETVNTYQDTDLTEIEAPLVENLAPPAGLISLCSYQGRLWALRQTSSTSTIGTGTLTLNNGNVLVVGSGTSFTTQCAAQQVISAGGFQGVIASITDNTHLTLFSPWPGTTGGSQAFTILTPDADGPRLYISLLPEETPIGRAEECWPAYNSRQVQEPKGLLRVGADRGNDSLVIQTGEGDKSVDGFDNRSFVIYELPTRGVAGFKHGAFAVNGTLVEFYRDHRLWDYTLGDIGISIQDKLDKIQDGLIEGSRLFWFSYQSRNYLFLSTARDENSSQNDVTYVWDYDLQKWYEWNLGFSAFGIVHTSFSENLQLWASDTNGQIIILFQVSADSNIQFQPAVSTALMRFESGRERLRSIQIYADPSAAEAIPPGGGSNQISVTNGSTAVVGVSTHFTQLQAGQRITIVPAISGEAAISGIIGLITDDTHLVLSSPWTGPTYSPSNERQFTASWPWTGTFFLDEDPDGVPFEFKAAPYNKQTSQGALLVWVPPISVRKEGAAFQFEIDFPFSISDHWIDRIVVMFDPDMDTAARS